MSTTETNLRGGHRRLRFERLPDRSAPGSWLLGTSLATLALMGGDNITTEERLRRAERHVAEGAQHVDRQRLLVEELEGSGQNAATERRILRQLEALQALQVAEL